MNSTLRRNLLRACFRRGVPLSLASDAHRPEDVGLDFDQALRLRGTAAIAK